ncbi:MAG TPA: 2,3-bisphosphoglycerate-independent phosphoglycerate mutase [Mariprofundaceae bacterium]|nr:2,3-bisphosphoglycerate-independent phosphoglycerate mutase [Mariprofundaceae bacterium]
MTDTNNTTLLIIMDGWGVGSGSDDDAISLANTPNFDRLKASCAYTEINTHGKFVGLPSMKDMGGSEVGHLTMGAGMILEQGPTRINNAIADGSFYDSTALSKVIEVGKGGGAIHLLGLLSDGNIHSHIDHFKAVIAYADKQDVERLYIHASLDGRDVGIQSAQNYILQLEELFSEINIKDNRDYAFASASGREHAIMDRDQDWGKVKRGWDAMVLGEAEHEFGSMIEAITSLRATSPDLVDQDMDSFIIIDDDLGKPKATIENGDAVLMMNFRGDRAIEITEAFEVADFSGFDRQKTLDVLYAGMMVFDEDRNLPELQLMGPTKVDYPLGRYLVDKKIKQFRLTETQKFPHVTFFFNGGYRKPLDPSIEEYILIDSDKGISFADKPEMKAPEIAAKAVALIETGEYGFGLINFANADMVGHCGKLAPAIKAVEAVDKAVGLIVDALEKHGGSAIITADHGNAEEMVTHTATGDEPCTKHSVNPVPCILFKAGGKYQLSVVAKQEPGLANLAATVCDMMKIETPANLEASLLMQ